MTVRRFVRPSLDNAWFVTLLYSALTIAFTWPLSTVLTTEVAWDLGDPVFICWVMMWTGGRVLKFLQGDWSALADYWHGNIFYPERLTVAYSEHFTPQMLQILPIYAATGNIVLCYNLLFLSALVLCGLGMYLFVREITGNALAAFVAGVAFAFAPYRVDQFSHLQVMGAQWMPLALYGFRRFAATGRARSLVGGTAALTTQVLSCSYYLFLFAPFAAAYLLYELIAHSVWRQRRVWMQITLAATVSLLIIAPFLIPYLEVREVAGMGVRTLDEVRAFSADTWALATASENLTFWGPRLQTFAKAEGNGFPGAITLVLALLGISVVAWRARLAPREQQTVPTRLWRSVVAVVITVIGLALLAGWVWLLIWGGGVTHLGAVRLSLRNVPLIGLWTLVWGLLALILVPAARAFIRGVPRSAGGFLVGGLLIALLLSFGPVVQVQGHALGAGPYMWLFEHVPGFNGMRVPARFLMVAVLFLTALAGIGMASIASRWRRFSYGLAAVLVVGMMAESAVMPFFTNKRLWVEHFDLESRDLASASTLGPVYNTVRDLPQGTVLAEIPYGAAPFDIKATFYAGFHGKPLLNGYSGFFPESFNKRIDTLGWDPSENRDAAWKTLLNSGATHVVVHEAAYFDGKGLRISEWLRSAGAKEVVANGTDRLFALK